ncbi:MAG: radical SAM protein, partial [Elusimicrobiota bacterium]
GALREAGYVVDILDASVCSKDQRLQDTFLKPVKQPNGLIRIGMDDAAIASFITKGGYDIVGVSSNFTPQTRMALAVVAAAKRANPAALIIAGGVNARNLPHWFLDNGVDLIAASEADSAIVEIVETHAKGGDFTRIGGLMMKRAGRMLTTPATALIDLDRLPMPTWDLLPFDKYEQIASPHGVLVSERAGARYAPIMTSRGCPFQCEYCHISTEKTRHLEGISAKASGEIGGLRLKSFERVIKEIDTLSRLGVKRLFFEDDSLLAKKERVRAIFREVKRYSMSIANVNGVNLVHLFKRAASGKLEPDLDFINILRDAGFDQLVFPVESGNQRILDKYATGKLHLETMDITALMRALTTAGIQAPINMMIGFPDESEEEMHKSRDLAAKLRDAGAPYVTFFIPIPFPGSHLYDMALSGSHLSADFDPDLMNWKRPVMKNTTVPAARIEGLRDTFWREINDHGHIEKRLKESAGVRWMSSGA